MLEHGHDICVYLLVAVPRKSPVFAGVGLKPSGHYILLALASLVQQNPIENTLALATRKLN